MNKNFFKSCKQKSICNTKEAEEQETNSILELRKLLYNVLFGVLAISILPAKFK